MNNIKFEDLKLSPEVLKAITGKGYEVATDIQAQSIPAILEGRDIIGESHTGSGKTAAFAIPIIEKIDQNNRTPQVLILSPTRELALQITNEIEELIKYKPKIKVLAVYGGQPIERQLRPLKSGVQIIVGTPGRLIDHLRRKTIKTLDVNTIVLDEADEMLNMGFEEDIIAVLDKIPYDHQTILFSATIPDRILKLTKKYQKDPVHIKIANKSLTVPNIEQSYIEVKENNKLEVLTRLVDFDTPNLAIIFCNTKRKVDELVEQLNSSGYAVEGIHGDMNQSKRDHVMKKFRNRSIAFLVATDVAARGIDVDDVEVVFNYDLPQDDEYYVHRIGRTSRIGKQGKAITLVTGRQIQRLRAIEKYIKAKVTKQDIPSKNAVNSLKKEAIVNQLSDIIDNQKYGYTADEFLSQLTNYSDNQIVKALYTLYIDNKMAKDEDDEKVTLFFNVGKKDKLKNRDFVKWLIVKTSILTNEIGNIDVHENYTFVEVPDSFADEIINKISKSIVKGRRVNVERQNKDNKRSNKRSNDRKPNNRKPSNRKAPK